MRPMGEIDEGAVREEVAERNRRVEEDCSRMRARRGGEMGQALLHLPEEERGDRDPAEGDLRARLLQGRLAQGPETHLEKDRTAAGGPLDQIHRSQRYRGTAAHLKRYLREAIRVEASGRKVPVKRASEYVMPEELQVRLNAAPRLKAAFEALTPGRRKSYLFHISTAKRPETRATRAEKCVPMILSGRGFNEFRRAPRRS